MPTPAKFASALLLALLAWLAVRVLTMEVLPEGMSTGLLLPVAIGFAAVVGWFMLGRAATGPAGKGDRASVVVTSGAMAPLVVAALVVVLGSFKTMIEKSMLSAYPEPYMAMEAWLEFLVDDVWLVLNAPMMAVLVGGGMVAGLLAWGVGRVTR